MDIFLPRMRPYANVQLNRAKKKSLSLDRHAEAMVASAEDMVIAKLEWFRDGGEVSERQWRDVIGILKVQAKTLDLNYLYLWVKELKIADLLERAMVEAQINEQ